jgi:hypothetical protein
VHIRNTKIGTFVRIAGWKNCCKMLQLFHVEQLSFAIRGCGTYLTTCASFGVIPRIGAAQLATNLIGELDKLSTE